MKTKVTAKPFGILQDGREVTAYTLHSGESYVTVLDLGGIVHSVVVPDQAGALVDVALGYDTPQEYFDKGGSLGVICGRFANRIEKGNLTVDGTTYHLYTSDRGNHIHGGKVGFAKKIWQAEIITDKAGNEELSLSLYSPDGEENYPGNLKVQVIYSFVDGALTLDYIALSDKATAINLTNHAYFNLNGAGSGSALLHTLWLDAESYLSTDATMIPRAVKKVAGTPFDFRVPKTVKEGDELLSSDEDLQKGQGFDHCFLLKKGRDRSRPFAILRGEKTGIELQCFTTQPSVQLYAGNFLKMEGKGGKYYGRCDGLCLETQEPPDNVNQPPLQEYGYSVYAAGEVYHYITRFAFGTV
ncbi:MAG: galactose mutarotase [Clostridia bacterium]|nr:galactose mutarotase [Clostridia bacterium]